MATRLKKGDQVSVITGRDKGKSGEVLKVYPKRDRVLIQGVNMVKRHTRPSGGNAGGIVEKETAIHSSNIAHIDPVDKKSTRIGFKTLADGKKVRFAKRSGEVIDT